MSRGWRGITMTPKAVAEIERLRRRRGPAEPPTPTDATREVIAEILDSLASYCQPINDSGP